ncbi:unnamed protein product [Plutella xylostella]|uniref:(diamondback moth) hypothetical protein n=1 Tax=Plutella xylostella TaxID=51655 RepID=A0A8S4FGD0_PLUXY|nr:unnamed protein product [Plutella xylostella]
MLILVLSLFATALAQNANYNFGPQPSRVVPPYVPASPPEIPPIDATDDIYQKDYWKNPHLVYNFQQVRRDQPAHVENREESLGKYFGRRRTTTTTPRPVVVPTIAPVVIPERQEPYYPPSPAPVQHSQNSYIDSISRWNQELNQDVPSVTVPPRPTPSVQRWQDVVANEQPAIPQYPSRLPTINADEFANIPTAGPYVPRPTPPPQTWHEPERYTVRPRIPPVTRAPFVASYQPEARVHQNSWVEEQPRVSEPIRVPEPSWNVEPARAPEAVPHRPSRPRGQSGRGQHKFNWSDVASDASSVETTTVAPVAANTPPPSVPTLTPWYGDNFGK